MSVTLATESPNTALSAESHCAPVAGSMRQADAQQAAQSQAAIRSSRLATEIEGLTMAELKEKIQEVHAVYTPRASSIALRSCLDSGSR